MTDTALNTSALNTSALDTPKPATQPYRTVNQGATVSTFQTSEPITLSIELASGQVDVYAVTTNTTEIELRPASPGDRDAEAMIERTRVEQTGETIVVHVPDSKGLGFLRRTPEIVITARVPAGSNLEAKLKSADLQVEGELGSAKVETASGDISVGDLSGDVRISAASGTVQLGTIGGIVRVQTASGDAILDTACGDCHVQTASGDIQIDAVEGEFNARTASGDVIVREAGMSANVKTASGDVELSQVASGKVDVTTASGDIIIGVQRGVVVWTDASSLTGNVLSSLEATELDGDSAGTLELRAHSTTGDISFRSA